MPRSKVTTVAAFQTSQKLGVGTQDELIKHVPNLAGRRQPDPLGRRHRKRHGKCARFSLPAQKLVVVDAQTQHEADMRVRPDLQGC